MKRVRQVMSWALLAGGLAIACVLAVIAIRGHYSHHPAASAEGAAAAPVKLPLRPAKLLIGVYQHGSPPSWAADGSFGSVTGAHVSLALTYIPWEGGFQTSFARMAARHGATILIQIQPTGISLARIAAGDYDHWLRSYAAHCRDYGHPVVIGFGHEMNGSWYSWGVSHQSPASFVAAWRHIVTVFRAAGASNVTWLWTINWSGHRPQLRSWWPGADYVTWVGIDGYEARPTDTFAKIFTQTVRAIRTFTRAPILLSETAVGPQTHHQAADILRLFAGIHRLGLLGLVWFNVTQHAGIIHQDWRLEDNPAALAAFRHGVTAMQAH
jgi:hypothetical protein